MLLDETVTPSRAFQRLITRCEKKCFLTSFNRLDKFWSDQDVLFDYKADLHGIGNGSIIY